MKFLIDGLKMKNIFFHVLENASSISILSNSFLDTDFLYIILSFIRIKSTNIISLSNKSLNNVFLYIQCNSSSWKVNNAFFFKFIRVKLEISGNEIVQRYLLSHLFRNKIIGQIDFILQLIFIG